MLQGQKQSMGTKHKIKTEQQQKFMQEKAPPSSYPKEAAETQMKNCVVGPEKVTVHNLTSLLLQNRCRIKAPSNNRWECLKNEGENPEAVSHTHSCAYINIDILLTKILIV